MLSSRLIERHVQRDAHRGLLRQLMDNDPSLPRPLEGALARRPAAILALALRRLLEVSYRPSPMAGELIDRLRDYQDLPGVRDDALTLASLAAAWRTVAHHPLVASAGAGRAREEALDRLVQLQAADGLLSSAEPATDEERALVTACVLMLLADDADFRARPAWQAMTRAIEQRRTALPRQLGRLCQAARPTGPAVAA
ncbi:MAG: hypothetical protein ACLFV3_07760 [Phycisphaeraceae bacterium]